MQIDWKSIIKTVAVAAGGALVASPDVQTAIVNVVPAPWNNLVAVGFGLVVMQLKPVAKSSTPPAK